MNPARARGPRRRTLLLFTASALAVVAVWYAVAWAAPHVFRFLLGGV
ncbi:hypothetical protein ABH931_004324 [Streptacidiphilus sp. MAP12-33]